MPTNKEKQSNENYLIENLQQKGWKYIPGKELDRTNYEDPILNKNFIQGLERINKQKGIELTEEDVNKVINELKLRGTGQEAHKQILEFFKKGISVTLQKTRDLARVELFDYDNLNNNEFIITNQPAYHSAQKEMYPDIVLYVNGIPLIIIECKDSGNPSVSWQDAFKQIIGYQKSFSEFFKYAQIGVASEAVAKYFPIVPWKDGDVRIYEWKEAKQEFATDISLSSIIEMLSPRNLLDILKDYLFFREEEGKESTKVITRYMQKRTVEKIFNRVTERIRGNEYKDRGLVWHWQGSGKTLTMIFAANKIYNFSKLENPTIFFVLDRKGLEDQLNQEFNSIGLTPKIQPITSIRELKKVLSADGGRGMRGYFSVLVHKFNQNELKDLQKQLEGIDNETVVNRKNIIAFVDESHRTQYGLLSAQMKAILKNAFFFAFTGTPIAKKQKNTYEEFAYPEEKELYLDRYFLTDSIKDGFTVQITYDPRLEEVHFNKEQLKSLLDIEDEELPEEQRERVKEKAKKKIDLKKAYYENRQRISKIAKDISEHFRDNVEGKFKAMVVAVNRNACINYKQELDKFLPEEDSEIIMTFNRNDSEVKRKYAEKLKQNYPGKELSEIREKIIEDFKNKEKPKILIVTDMLLTGFDAPVLQTMYLDKPLKEHNLLQAVARTNRPYKGVKEAGVIIDYLGILKNFYKAFEMYSDNKIKKDMEEALVDKEKVKREFKENIEETLKIFEGIKQDYKRDNLIKAIERLSYKDNSKKFTQNYRKLRKKFELLGADPEKVDYAQAFGWLSWIYINYLKQLNQSEDYEDSELVNKYFRKTIKYIHATTKVDQPAHNLPVINFDENYINKINEKFKSKKEKASNMVFTLNRYMLVDRKKSPIYEDLAEKVAKLMEAWREKTKDFEQIYQEGLEILKEREQRLSRQKKLGYSNKVYSVLILLENYTGGIQEKTTSLLFNELKESDYQHQSWEKQVTSIKNVEKLVRGFLLKNYVKPELLEYNKVDELTEKIMDILKQNE